MIDTEERKEITFINDQPKEIVNIDNNGVVDLVKTEEDQVGKNTNQTLELLILASISAYIWSVFAPMIDQFTLVVFAKSFSILASVVLLIEDQKIFAALFMITYFILIPFANIGALYKIISSKLITAGSIYIIYIIHKIRWANITILAVIVALLEFGAFKRYEPTTNAYLYFIAPLLVIFTTNKVFDHITHNTKMEINEVINSEIRKLKLKIKKLFMLSIKLVFATAFIAIAVKFSLPYLQDFNGNNHSTSAPTPTPTTNTAGHINNLQDDIYYVS